MSKYINSEKLLSEIVSQIDSLPKSHAGNIMGDALRGVLVCINTLQQEQSEVDLDKEVHRFFEECIEVHEVPLYGKVKEGVISVDCYELTARHFAEWGAIHLNARKEE